MKKPTSCMNSFLHPGQRSVHYDLIPIDGMGNKQYYPDSEDPLGESSREKHKIFHIIKMCS